MPTGASQHIERLRAWRTRKPRTRSFADMVPNLQRQLKRTERQVGDFADAWHACVPPALRDRTKVEHIRGGVARVTANAPAIAFQLDRALRSGLLQTLRESCTTTITRVDIRVGRVCRPER